MDTVSLFKAVLGVDELEVKDTQDNSKKVNRQAFIDQTDSDDAPAKKTKRFPKQKMKKRQRS
jgi:hypothetical protein